MRLQKISNILFCLLLTECIATPAARPQNSQDQAPASDVGKITVTVTVTDRDHHPVTGLKAEDFALYEDGQQQPIDSISSDVPACIGLVVDMSGSMRPKLAEVDTALLDFVRAGNSEDRVFVVNFNYQPYLDQDFTRDIGLVDAGLRRAVGHAETALYDAVIASADHLAKGRNCQKRVLVVVSDGEDNASRKSLQQTIMALQDSQGSLVYAIGLESGHSHRKPAARRALETLTGATGGAPFLIDNDKDLGRVLRRAAEEIRSQYTISYAHAPSTPGTTAPKLKIEVRAPGRKDLMVRTGGPANANQQPAVPDQPVVAAKQAAAPARLPVDVRDQPTGPAPPLLPLTSCIAGSVVDDEGRAAEGITVEIVPAFATNAYPRNGFPSAVSDEKGEFRIRDLEAGRYRIDTANESQGYPPTKYQFYQYSNVVYAVASEACDNIVLKLGPKAARLRVKAVDPATGDPVGRFRVYLRSATRGSFFAQSDRDHDLLVPANAELTIMVSAPGYSRGQSVVATTPGAEASQEVTVPLGPPLNTSNKKSPD